MEFDVVEPVHASHNGNILCQSPSYVAQLERLGLLPETWRRACVTCPACIAVMGGGSKLHDRGEKDSRPVVSGTSRLSRYVTAPGGDGNATPP